MGRKPYKSGENNMEMVNENSMEGVIGVPETEEIKETVKPSYTTNNYTYKEEEVASGEGLINCLQNRKVTIQFIKRQRGNITNKDHFFYGGLAQKGTFFVCVPLLKTGQLMNVLTDDEKNYLEYALGLPKNSLSIYAKKDNFWHNRGFTIGKEGITLDLSSPMDYIYYKIAQANGNLICKSVKELQDKPKATYMFVIVDDTSKKELETVETDINIKAWINFGKIQTDKYTMVTIIELMTGKPFNVFQDINIVKNALNNLIKKDAKLFLNFVEDKMISFKTLIKKGIALNLISKRDNYYYIKETNEPMCGSNETPNINMAAKWLADPTNQEFKFSIEAKYEAQKKA
jgi:hypothetical protein|nr:MAG TPA: hypothetical protein [Caudoviricetes sp.]